MTDIVIWWLRAAGLVYVLIGVALYLDKDRDRIRRHCSRPGIVALKLLAGPLTLAVIAFWILTALPRFLWNERLAGCKVGNRRPVTLRMAGETPLAAARRRRDAARLEEARARAEYAEYARRELEPRNVSAEVARTAMELGRGPDSLVREEKLDEAIAR